jgi:dynein heavy chain
LINFQIEPLEKEADIVKEMYDLIEAFTVPTPPEDFAVYQTLSPSIINVKNAVDKSLTERDANIDKFCNSLDKDIAELAKEVKEIKQESQVCISSSSQSSLCPITSSYKNGGIQAI